MDKHTPNQVTAPDPVEQWFPQFVENINCYFEADHLMLQTGTVPKERYEFLKSIMIGDADAVHKFARQTSSMHFIGKVTFDFFTELLEKKITPDDINLAMALADSKVLIWAELKDNDEETEDTLLLIEDKINSKYYSYGFSISVTTVEKSDNLKPPVNFNLIGK